MKNNTIVRIIENAHEQKGNDAFSYLDPVEFVQHLDLAPNQFCFVYDVAGKLCCQRDIEKVTGYSDDKFNYEFLMESNFIDQEEKQKLFRLASIALISEIKLNEEPLITEYGLTNRMLKANGTFSSVRLNLVTLKRNRLNVPTHVLFVCSDLGPANLSRSAVLSISEKEPFVISSDHKKIKRKDDIFTKREKETVDVFRKKLLKKTKTASATELVSNAIMNGWI